MSTKTAEGRIVGTVGYMAPEQVRGKDIDARADIFALGAVLYEMLSGERAFTGETTADTLTAVLTKDPGEMSRPGRPVPIALDRLVRRCLEKDPDERFQSARDVAFALEAESGASRSGEAETPVVPRREWSRWATTAAIALLAAAAGAGLAHRLWSRPHPPPRLRQLTYGHGRIEEARFTADGHTMVFTAYWNGQPPEIRSQRFDQSESVSLGLPPARLASVSSRGELAIILTPPDELGSFPVVLGTLARVPLAGGTARPVLEDVAVADWSPDGQSLAVVRCGDGPCRVEYPVGHVLYSGIELNFGVGVRVSPRGDRVAVLDEGDLVLLDPDGGSRRLKVGEGPKWPAWLPHGGALLVAAADPGRPRSIRRVGLDGTVAELYASPGDDVLHDVGPDGQVLLHHGLSRLGVRGQPPGAPSESELIGVLQAVCRGLSADGTRVLVWSGPSQETYLGSLDGKPSMRLGEGLGGGLSEDAEWAVLRPDLDNHSRFVLMPTGTGDAVPFDTRAPQTDPGSWSGYWTLWHVNAERAGFISAETRRPQRGFLFERSTGQTRAVTPENTIALPGLTPDDYVLAWAEDGTLTFHPLSGGEARPVAARLPTDGGEAPIRASGDGRFLFLEKGNVPKHIERLELATGQRTPWKTVRPTDPTGVWGIYNVLLTPDGEGYAYTYGRALTDLYLLEGLEY